jgi:predicted nucleic acid-binding protein
MEVSQIIACRAYFDTNVFIYLIENHPGYRAKVASLVQYLEASQCAIYTSELALAECLAKPFAEKNQDAQNTYLASIKTSDFLTVKPVTRKILVQASRLRAQTKNKLPDCIHLATALVHACDIFVGNDRRLNTGEEINSIILADLVV